MSFGTAVLKTARPVARPPGDPPSEESRHVVGPDGVTWRVSEREPPPHLADRCERCLIFDAGAVVRRVCGEGPGWRLRSDAELLALCVGPA